MLFTVVVSPLPAPPDPFLNKLFCLSIVKTFMYNPTPATVHTLHNKKEKQMKAKPRQLTLQPLPKFLYPVDKFP